MYEIFVKLQTGRSAFFRMKLGGKQVVASDHTRKSDAIHGFTENVGSLRRHRIVAVYEIEIAVIGDSFPQRMCGGLPDRIPSHLRHLVAGPVLLQHPFEPEA